MVRPIQATDDEQLPDIEGDNLSRMVSVYVMSDAPSSASPLGFRTE